MPTDPQQSFSDVNFNKAITFKRVISITSVSTDKNSSVKSKGLRKKSEVYDVSESKEQTHASQEKRTSLGKISVGKLKNLDDGEKLDQSSEEEKEGTPSIQIVNNSDQEFEKSSSSSQLNHQESDRSSSLETESMSSSENELTAE